MSRFAHPSESAQSLLPCHEFVLQLKSCTRAARFIRERKAEKEESVSVARFGCWRARIRRRVGQDVGGKGLDSPRCDCLRCTAIWRAPSKVAGLSGGTRTPDLLLRRQLLYPVELRADQKSDNVQDKGPTMRAFDCVANTCDEKKMVGAAGFELATLCSQSRCATRLRYAPTKGAFYMGSAGHAGWTQLNFAKLQRFLYCVCPKSTSFSASVRNGLRRSASTATPRCTAGRAAMRLNQALSAG